MCLNQKLWQAGMCLTIALAAFLLSGMKTVIAAKLFSAGKAKFSVRCNGQILRYQVQGVFVLPAENIVVEILDAKGEGNYVLKTPEQEVFCLSERKCCWQAPREKGVYPTEIYCEMTGERMFLNIFVMVPWQDVRSGRLNGYRVGNYPRKRKHGSIVYKPPRGFIEITAKNQNLLVSPHFRLKQFLCKQSERFPEYIVLNERLLVKLEKVLERLNASGYSCQTLHIMSGYRTPYYNRKIGNVRYSSHIWGQAADVFVDENHDGYMDDLNGDGKCDYHDTQIIYQIADAIDHSCVDKFLVGGLGLYAKTRYHGPFVHIDVRGKRARWGIVVNQPAMAAKHFSGGCDR